jgi:hypothetical protein
LKYEQEIEQLKIELKMRGIDSPSQQTPRSEDEFVDFGDNNEEAQIVYNDFNPTPPAVDRRMKNLNL